MQPDRLLGALPSPVVALNRAVVHSMAFGPNAGLTLLEELEGLGALRAYAPLPAAKGGFLFRAGRLAEAPKAFLNATNLSRNRAECQFLLPRAEACLPYSS